MAETPTIPTLTQMSDEELAELEELVERSKDPEAVIGQPLWDGVARMVAELRRHRSAAQVSGEGMDAPVGLVTALMRFYSVGTVAALIVAQDEHIKKLQEKRPVREPLFPGSPRHG